MSVIRSFSVGNGDMFYIQHGSDNFTIIDCCLGEDDAERIIREIIAERSGKTVTRFVSTHPDDDHIRGLELLDDRLKILNFYCVDNDAWKADSTDSFDRYCELRDSPKAFKISRGCSRKWMNIGDAERGTSGIEILWPNLDHPAHRQALQDAGRGLPNNLSPIIKYSLEGGPTALWMGDLETEFMEDIEDDLALPRVDLLFAPHHGRHSGRIPSALLNQMDPKVIVVGEAPSQHLNYYQGYDTITQNSAGDLWFECAAGVVDVFARREYDVAFLQGQPGWHNGRYYVGRLAV